MPRYTLETFETSLSERDTKGKHSMPKRDVTYKGKSLSWLKKRAWKLLSEIIRREAADSTGHLTCYTSGVRLHWKDAQAGHAIGGRHGAVLFDEEIIRPQSVRENVMLRGNYPVFVAKLIELHGLDWWKSKLIESHQTVKWNRSDLISRIEDYSKRLEAL